MKKKKLVGWVKEDWQKYFVNDSSFSAFTFFPTTYISKEKRFNTKVRITIEELK